MSPSSRRVGPLAAMLAAGAWASAVMSAACDGTALKAGSMDPDPAEPTGVGPPALGGGGERSKALGPSVIATGGTGKQATTPARAGAPTQAQAGAATEALAGAGSGGASPESPYGGQAGEPNDAEPREPDCAVPIADGWNHPLGSDQTPWVLEFGDPHVDASEQRLVVTYDDIAKRDEELRGGYYLSARVTFEGGTVFTPYPYVWQVALPSFRRNAAGTGIELGSTAYGTFESWRVAPVGWGGVTIPTKELVVVAYVKAGAKAYAVKAIAGAAVYRSGWVTGFTWEDTNLGVMRYVGENNSGVYNGSSDALYVSPVSGCQSLSDAAVEAAYAN
jgi:hypothetical protein